MGGSDQLHLVHRRCLGLLIHKALGYYSSSDTDFGSGLGVLTALTAWRVVCCIWEKNGIVTFGPVEVGMNV